MKTVIIAPMKPLTKSLMMFRGPGGSVVDPSWPTVLSAVDIEVDHQNAPEELHYLHVGERLIVLHRADERDERVVRAEAGGEVAEEVADELLDTGRSWRTPISTASRLSKRNCLPLVAWRFIIGLRPSSLSFWMRDRLSSSSSAAGAPSTVASAVSSAAGAGSSVAGAS